MFRLFDILFSCLFIILLSSLLLPIILILSITGERKIFYLQNRIGLNGKLFKLFKFATMLENSPNMYNGTITVTNDPRVLPFGKFLRKCKLNELPQLINILIGDMSLIGPRPLVQSHFNYYSRNIQNKILLVKPGLSGVGSIIFRDEEKWISKSKDKKKYYNEVIAPYKGQLEIWYIKNQSLFNYFILIFLTIEVVLNPKSRLIWKVIKNLPSPPTNLNKQILE